MTAPAAGMPNEELLDNPIWNSLVTGHAELATGGELARRYPSSIGPLAGMREPNAEAYAELAGLIPANDVAVLFLEDEPAPPPGWELVQGGALVQMICRGVPGQGRPSDPIVSLGTGDYPDMVALASLTEPGPFRERTASLGSFLGIRVGGKLAAMAGERLHPDGFTEISAVCTHPEFRGRGYAGALVAAVAYRIRGAARVPFLTALDSNRGAIRVYEQVGFTLRRTFQLAVLKPPPGANS